MSTDPWALAGINSVVRGTPESKIDLAKQYAALGALTPETLKKYSEEIARHPYAPASLKEAARSVMECYVCFKKEIFSESNRNRLRVCSDCKRRFANAAPRF